MAERLHTDPKKLVALLKGTCFRSEKEMSNEQLQMLVIVCNEYRLNPLLKEIYAYPDKGGIVPVVSVDGWIRIINEHSQMDGLSI